MSGFSLPPIEAFLDAHQEYIDEFGGDSGVRDQGRLEAALGRAQSLIDYGDNPTLFEIAAVVSHGINSNHAFVDGNKRVSIGAIVTVLYLNGYYLDVTEREATAVTYAVVENEMDHIALADWIRDNAVKVER